MRTSANCSVDALGLSFYNQNSDCDETLANYREQDLYGQIS